MVPLTPRQVAVRAQETASQLVATLDRNALVPKFLHGYVSEHKRPGRTSEPQRYRDLVETIRREALLVLVLQIESEAARGLGISRRITPAQSKLVNLFCEEFSVALRRGLDWDKQEFDNFRRDLELFRSLYADMPQRPKRGSARGSPRGPFVDRCGLLLDAPMLDQARRAAVQFEAELVATASSVLRKVLSRRGLR